MVGTFAQRIAAAVRAETARRRVSQQSLASKVGMTQPALSRRMNGHVQFSPEELLAVAQALDVDPGLFGVTEPGGPGTRPDTSGGVADR